MLTDWPDRPASCCAKSRTAPSSERRPCDSCFLRSTIERSSSLFLVDDRAQCIIATICCRDQRRSAFWTPYYFSECVDSSDTVPVSAVHAEKSEVRGQQSALHNLDQGSFLDSWSE